MKTALSIPDDVFDKAEYLAKKRGMSRSELYVEAIKAYIARDGDRATITEALNKVYGDAASDRAGEAAGLDAATGRAARRTLEDVEW